MLQLALLLIVVGFISGEQFGRWKVYTYGEILLRQFLLVVADLVLSGGIILGFLSWWRHTHP